MSPESTDELSLRPFAGPRYWPTWFLWLGMRLLALLPFRAQLAIGYGMGRLLPLVMGRQKRIAARNLEVCFPELSPEERRDLLKRHFESVGMSFVEMGIGWFSPLDRLRRLIRVEGREHLDRAVDRGKGILIQSAHFTTLETGVSLFEELCPGLSCMYRPQRNAMMDVMIRRGRSRFAGEQIPRDNVRALLRALKKGRIVAYMPDQTYVGNQSELLPFFGEPAMTNIATSKLARISDATVLLYLFRRLPGTEGYVVNILPAPGGVPSENAIDDTRKLVRVLEDYIRLAPEQYLWLYKKFKGRPAPLPNIYKDV